MTEHGPHHPDLAGYVLDALSAGERRQFERHLESCVTCRAELAELREPRSCWRVRRRRTSFPPVSRPEPSRRSNARPGPPPSRCRVGPGRGAGCGWRRSSPRRPWRRSRSSSGRGWTPEAERPSSRPSSPRPAASRAGDRGGPQDRDRPGDPFRQRRPADPAEGRVLRALVRRAGRHARRTRTGSPPAPSTPTRTGARTFASRRPSIRPCTRR